jgi:hypothetical protein
MQEGGGEIVGKRASRKKMLALLFPGAGGGGRIDIDRFWTKI